jgi:hypothetical protein
MTQKDLDHIAKQHEWLQDKRLSAQSRNNQLEILYRLQRITRLVYVGLSVLLVLVGLVGWRLLAP